MTFSEAISSGFRNYAWLFRLGVPIRVLVLDPIYRSRGPFHEIIDLRILSSKIQLISSIWSLVTCPFSIFSR